MSAPLTKAICIRTLQYYDSKGVLHTGAVQGKIYNIYQVYTCKCKRKAYDVGIAFSASTIKACRCRKCNTMIKSSNWIQPAENFFLPEFTPAMDFLTFLQEKTDGISEKSDLPVKISEKETEKK